MEPLTTMAMLDATRWRLLVYSESAISQARLSSFSGPTSNDTRRAVLVVMRASLLERAMTYADRVQTIMVFDKPGRLSAVAASVPSLRVVDMEQGRPRPLTAAEVMELARDRDPGVEAEPSASAGAGEGPAHDASSSGMSAAGNDPADGSVGGGHPGGRRSADRPDAPSIEGLLDDLRAARPADAAPPFTAIAELYARFLFQLVPRTALTREVTRKLEGDAREIWTRALKIATSRTGRALARVYRQLCAPGVGEPEREAIVGAAELGQHEGDFRLLAALVPPSEAHVFVDAGDAPAANARRPPSRRRGQRQPEAGSESPTGGEDG